MKDDVRSAGHGRAMAALAGCILLASLAISMATVALPTLARAFAAEIPQVQWVVLAYLLAVTVAIVPAGRMGDLYGNRRVLAAGLGLFALASTVCALAPGLSWLIAGRAAQGLGGAVLMALPLSMAKGLAARERLGAAMGLLGSMSAIGTALGPSLGGVLIGTLGWQAAFALPAACGAALLALVLHAIPGARGAAAARARMDWRGVFWLLATLLCFTLYATGAGVAAAPWLLPALGAVAAAAFVRSELAAERPLVPLALLRGPTLAAALLMNLLVATGMMATLVVGPFFLAFGLGLDAPATGMVMAAGPVAAALSGVPAGRLTDRFGARRSRMGGLALAVAGLLAFAVLPPLLHVPGYVAALVLVTPGFQLFLAANSTAAMRDAAEQERGMVSGLLGLSRNLGFVAGASLMPLLFAALLGGQGVAGSSMQAIGAAFGATFMAAAGLCLLAMLAAHRTRVFTD